MHSKQITCIVTAFLMKLYVVESTIYLIDTFTSRMLELPENEQPCKVHYDRLTMEATLNRVDPRYIQRVSPDILNQVSNSCKNSNRINKTGGFIFPGTKWCGPGTIAAGYNDLGIHAKEDRCCRDHDHCPNQLEPGQCRHGICNISPFTRSHCDCDETFRKCLRDVNTDIANVLGTVYFNIAQGACFRERRFCPQTMRDNPSYSWFCEEWKLMPSDYFTSRLNANINYEPSTNEILEKDSKIKDDLEKIFGNDEDVAKILKKS